MAHKKEIIQTEEEVDYMASVSSRLVYIKRNRLSTSTNFYHLSSKVSTTKIKKYNKPLATPCSTSLKPAKKPYFATNTF